MGALSQRSRSLARTSRWAIILLSLREAKVINGQGFPAFASADANFTLGYSRALPPRAAGRLALDGAAFEGECWLVSVEWVAGENMAGNAATACAEDDTHF